MARHDDAQFLAIDWALGCVDAHDLTVRGAHAGDFAFLDDVHAHIGTCPRIAPCNRVMTGGAAAGLPERAQNRIARAVDIDDRAQVLDPFGADEFGFDALEHIGVGRALVAANFVVGLCQHHHAAGAEHDVIVQVLADRFIQTARLFIDRRRRVLQIVRPDDRGVAARVAAAKPAFFDNRHIGDAVFFAQPVCGCQPMAACSNDHGLVFFAGIGGAPRAFPALMVAGGFAGDSKGRIAAHGSRILWQ